MSAARCLWIVLLPLGLMAAGCGERETVVRTYREIAIEAHAHDAHDGHAHEAEEGAAADLAPADAARRDMASTPVPTGGAKLRWTTPEGWIEQPGSAMRMATFLVGPSRSECTIMSFPGEVGGVEANLRRWLGQLEAKASDADLAAFARAPAAFATEGGLDGRLYDFDTLLPAGAPASMLAAILPLEGQTVFVKLTGPRDLLAAEKERFTAFCRSLSP